MWNRPVDASIRTVGGWVDDGYGPVADAFRVNSAERDELGAADVVYRESRKVVDLWGMLVDVNLDRPDVLAVEIPAANGIGTPRAIAGIAYCYAPNRLGTSLIDQREIALRDLFYREVLHDRPQQLV